MPYVYLTTDQLVRALACADDGSPDDTNLVAALEHQTTDVHKIVRELTYVGSEAHLREMLARSSPEGPVNRGTFLLTVRTISNSLPQRTDPVEG